MADNEPMIPLDLIRRALKIEDYQGVPDSLLELYAEAALEALRDFTAREFGPRRMVREVCKTPNWQNATMGARARIFVPLSFPAEDGYITLFWNGRSQVITVKPGARQFEWPWSFPRPMQTWVWPLPAQGLENQCDGCGNSVSAPLPEVTYATGGTYDKLPPGALIGCLKYIAWTYEHPGDELVTVLDRSARVANGSAQGTNNALIGSGAYQEWKRYRRGVYR